MNLLELGRPLHEAFGTRFPVASLVIVTVIGTVVGGLAAYSYWTYLANHRDKEQRLSPNRSKEDRAQEERGPDNQEPQPTFSSAKERHLSREQVEQMKRALLPFAAGKIGIYVLKGRKEREVFASELAEAFRQSGWLPIRDPQYDPETFKWEMQGVLLIRHQQSNMPDLKPLLAAFTAANIDHSVIDVGHPMAANLYHGAISTDVLVIFVGPRAINPATQY